MCVGFQLNKLETNDQVNEDEVHWCKDEGARTLGKSLSKFHGGYLNILQFVQLQAIFKTTKGYFCNSLFTCPLLISLLVRGSAVGLRTSDSLLEGVGTPYDFHKI